MPPAFLERLAPPVGQQQQHQRHHHQPSTEVSCGDAPPHALAQPGWPTGIDEIYLGNISPSVASSHLQELLSLAGPAEVRLPLDADGRHKGFAFGMYADAQVASYAIRLLDGIVLGGQPLRARHASRSSR